MSDTVLAGLQQNFKLLMPKQSGQVSASADDEKEILTVRIRDTGCLSWVISHQDSHALRISASIDSIVYNAVSPVTLCSIVLPFLVSAS